MEQTIQSFPGTNFQLRPRPTEPASSIQSSSSDEPSSGLRAPPRRKSLPNPKNTKGPPAKINTSSTASRSTKPTSAGPRSGTNHGAIMHMSGTISPAQEITYTPTTHRISKAKKGKKVHACEYPGCHKVGYSRPRIIGSRCLSVARFSREQSTESKSNGGDVIWLDWNLLTRHGQAS